MKRGLKASIQTYTFNDIAKINYLPLLQTYIITMKRTDTYFIFNPIFYSSESFDKFKNILQLHLPIQRGYHIPLRLLIYTIEATYRLFGCSSFAKYHFIFHFDWVYHEMMRRRVHIKSEKSNQKPAGGFLIGYLKH